MLFERQSIIGVILVTSLLICAWWVLQTNLAL